MNYSRRFPQMTPAKAPPRFMLVEEVAIPLALCVMEAQPIAMVIALFTLLGGSTLAHVPLGIGAVLLLQLGLLWWAMALAFLQISGRLRSGRVLAMLRLCGLLIAWLLVSLPRLAVLGSGTQDVILAGELFLVLWLWYRGLTRARLGFSHEPLATAFTVGLGVLLAVMLFTLVAKPALPLLPQLQASLTIYFLSGLVTLSLARLGVLRQARTQSGKQADPTRSWVGALTLFSGVLIVLVFLLEAAFSYTSFLEMMQLLHPVWDVLGTLVGWVLYALVFLVLSPLFALFSWLIGLIRGNGKGQQTIQPPSSPLAHLSNLQHPTGLSPELVSIGRWVVLGIAGLLLLLLVRASLRRWFLPYDAEQLEETREQLDRRLFTSPRQPRTRRARSPQAPFSGDPNSARAQYRRLLHTVAAARPDLAHQLDETPLEYEQRLGPHVDPGNVPVGDEQVTSQKAKQVDPPVGRVLETLTQMYQEERYGGQELLPQQQADLHTWMPRLLEVFTGKGDPLHSQGRTRSGDGHTKPKTIEPGGER
jgi:hypothetical protein